MMATTIIEETFCFSVVVCLDGWIWSQMGICGRKSNDPVYRNKIKVNANTYIINYMYKILKLLILNLKPRYIISFTILCTNKSPPLSHTRNELLHCTKFKISVLHSIWVNLLQYNKCNMYIIVLCLSYMYHPVNASIKTSTAGNGFESCSHLHCTCIFFRLYHICLINCIFNYDDLCSN